MDVDTIEPGMDFQIAIRRAVESCMLLIAVIGQQWTTAADRRGRRRLDDPEDLVALEVGAALLRDIRVVPVLVDGANMPDRDELPNALRPLARRNAIRIDHETFTSDVGRLLTLVDQVLGRASVTVAEDREPVSAKPVSAPASRPAKLASSPRAEPQPRQQAVDPLANTPTAPSIRQENERYTFIVTRGNNAGAVLRPHVYSDGCFVVSTSRFARDQERVPRDERLEPWLRQGYKLRMSIGGSGPRPSLISPEQIIGLDS